MQQTAKRGEEEKWSRDVRREAAENMRMMGQWEWEGKHKRAMIMIELAESIVSRAVCFWQYRGPIVLPCADACVQTLAWASRARLCYLFSSLQPHCSVSLLKLLDTKISSFNCCNLTHNQHSNVFVIIKMNWAKSNSCYLNNNMSFLYQLLGDCNGWKKTQTS